MNRGVFGILLAFTCAGCSVEKAEPAVEESVSTSPAVPEAPKLDIPSELVGHAWKSGEHLFIFQKGGNVLVRGGHIQDSMPNGAPSRFELKGEELKLDVLGIHYTGTWNGQQLVINDQIAEYSGPNSDFLK